MASLTRFSIVTPSALKFEGDAEIVVAPGAAGDLGALANHAPLLTTLRTGVVRATVAGGGGAESGASATASTSASRLEFAVQGGFMEVLPDKVIILTDMALSRDEINVADAHAELKRAEETLAQKRGGDDSAERRAVAWAQAKLEVTRRPA